MKKRIENKRLRQSFTRNDGCERCGSKRVIHKMHFIDNNKYLGNIEFDCWDNVGYFLCLKCGYISATSELTFQRNEAEMAKVELLLKEKYPVESNEYLTYEEMAGMKNWNYFSWNQEALNYAVYSLEHNGERLYLKKSLDLYNERCCVCSKEIKNGHFKLID